MSRLKSNHSGHGEANGVRPLASLRYRTGRFPFLAGKPSQHGPRMSCGGTWTLPITIKDSAGVAAAELVNAAGGVDESLLARIEWVAGGADFDMEVLAQGGPGLERIAATTADDDGRIGGVDFWLHGVVPGKRWRAKNKSGILPASS